MRKADWSIPAGFPLYYSDLISHDQAVDGKGHIPCRHQQAPHQNEAPDEAADVVLMDDAPMQISKAIKISRKCLGTVYQNIVVAIGVKLACLVLVALGFANMWLAVFADVGVMIIAVLNAIRALFVKNL